MRARPEVEAEARAEHGGPRGSRDEVSPVRLDFSASLNAWGPAPEVAEAARSAPLDRYPDPEALGPRRAAAASWGLSPDEVAFGAGAAELLHAVCFAFLRPRDSVLLVRPTFGEYSRSARLCGARVLELPAMPPAWQTPLETMRGALARLRPRLAFLCAPNNPSGERLAAAALLRVADACAAAGTLLVLDQSYDSFLDEPLGTPPFAVHPAMLCVRSITKEHALAGVRAAFAVGPVGIMAALERARVPWSASSPAQAAAVAALGEAGEAHLRATLPRLRAERRRLEERLRALGLATVPTATHFLLVEVGSAAELARRLRVEHGIGVRDCASFGLPSHIRVAARRPEENEWLLAALEAVCSH